jgi:hypothetical protein
MLKLLTLAAAHFHFSSAQHPCCTAVQRKFALHGFSARALARTQPVASVINWTACEAAHSASDLSRRSHLLLPVTQRSLWGRPFPRRKTLGSHNPLAKDGIGAVYVRTGHLLGEWRGGTWVSWRGTGMERYGTDRNATPAQHCHHAAHLYQYSQFGARIAQQAILRLPAGSSQAHLYNQTPQLCHSLQQL